jgi:predicted site-specific integrase-resolvase
MPGAINSETYYRAAETDRVVGVRKDTLLRWLRKGKVTDIEHKDNRGWSSLNQAEVEAIKNNSTEIRVIRFEGNPYQEQSRQVKYILRS